MPVIPPVILNRLLAGIEADNLVMLCGAGLSIPPPASLMSAQRVSQACYDKWLPTEQLPAAMRNNIDLLSGHFYANGQFESVFISTLVPWDDLVGQPNSGHAATADFLICRAAKAALSANFDPLIEQWGQQQKIALRGALDGQEASSPAFIRVSSPLLKFHGCFLRGPNQTLWTHGQLIAPPNAQRVASCSQWMNMNLPGSDLLIVGFWSDWGYLNDVIANALAINGATSITVVDPSPTAELQGKAPTLWAKLTSTTAPFEHVQESSDAFLEELRTEFSKVWAKKFFLLGRPLFEADGHVYAPAMVDPTPMTIDELYDLRRDADGTPYHRAAKSKFPKPAAAQAALAHLLLITAHAARIGTWYEHNGMRIRIVHGGGQSLAVVKESYDEPPSILQPDIVICAGADNFGAPGRLVASGRGASIVRPAVGGSARWLTLHDARAEFAL
jgi:hypothetical protein